MLAGALIFIEIFIIHRRSFLAQATVSASQAAILKFTTEKYKSFAIYFTRAMIHLVSSSSLRWRILKFISMCAESEKSGRHRWGWSVKKLVCETFSVVMTQLFITPSVIRSAEEKSFVAIYDHENRKIPPVITRLTFNASPTVKNLFY